MNALVRIALLLASIPLSACLQGYDSSSTQSPIAYYDCTLTQGYWKNHPRAWPVSTLTVGSITYTKEEALAVFRQEVNGNGLISLAHQLMASKLNVAAGATNAVAGAIAQADVMIGTRVAPSIGNGTLPTSLTSPLVQELDEYNIGNIGPGHCNGEDPKVDPPECICGDGAIHLGEQCDDGNRVGGDGCSATCQVEQIN